MGTFFQDLKIISNDQEWCKVLDWLFDDLRFSDNIGWSKEKSQKYTIKIKDKKNLSKFENNYFFLPLKKIDYKSLIHSYRKKNFPLIILHKGKDGESKGIIRHIRNGIAHGNAQIIVQESPYIEVTDINKDKQQTAYIYIPLSYIKDFFDYYREIIDINNSQKVKEPLLKTKKKKRK
ncbi:MAG: hypothetical protein IJI57_10095 [Flexilinea sp.]|nr:hypothetical protein [Flexilinea sp.]